MKSTLFTLLLLGCAHREVRVLEVCAPRSELPALEWIPPARPFRLIAILDGEGEGFIAQARLRAAELGADAVIVNRQFVTREDSSAALRILLLPVAFAICLCGGALAHHAEDGGACRGIDVADGEPTTTEQFHVQAIVYEREP